MKSVFLLAGWKGFNIGRSADIVELLALLKAELREPDWMQTGLLCSITTFVSMSLMNFNVFLT